MSILIVNRRRNADISEEKTLPGNPFVIRESNLPLFVKQVLIDDPLTISFSSDLTISNTAEETTFDFGSFDLTPQQETDALTVITQYRDKSEFSTLDQFNIDAKTQIDEAIEQLGDVFDEDSIADLILPDFCDLRNQVKSIYETNGWSSFTVGEKRILIADWLVTTNSEILEIFQGNQKRSEIFRLFGAKVSDLHILEIIRLTEKSAEDNEGDAFTKIFERFFSIGKADLSNEVFVSRSNTLSGDADSQEVEIPVFGNVRNEANFLNIISDTEIEITRPIECDISYTCSVATSENINYQIKAERERNGVITGVDVQGMLLDGRGRGTLTHTPIRVDFNQGDRIKFKLLKQNSSGGSLTVISGRGKVRIEEVFK